MSRSSAHQQLDERSLALHRLVVDKARREPACMAAVRQTLARWQAQASERVQPHLSEWATALAAGDEAAWALALEQSDRGQALRQSSPFCGVLTAQERQAFFKAWRSRDEPGPP